MILKKKRILITGCKGLIGSSLWNRLKNKYQLYGYDIIDSKTNNFSNKVDMIIHCASYCIIRDVIKDPSLMMKNINFTYLVMEKAKKDKAQVILMSSGRLNSSYCSPYVVGKQFIENIAKAYKNCYNIDNIIIRPETIWGYKNNDNRVIPSWINKAKNNEDLIVFGDNTKELSPLFVEDFTYEIIKIIDNFNSFKNGNSITITGGSMKVCDIINIIKDFYNSKSKVIFLDQELSQPQYVSMRKESDIILNNRLKENLK